MTPQLLAKQANELLTMFSKEYQHKTGAAPLLNRAREKWAARELIESFGIDDCKSAMEWYFTVNRRWDWKSFVYSADQCITESRSVHEDRERRKKFRVIANEWRNS